MYSRASLSSSNFRYLFLQDDTISSCDIQVVLFPYFTRYKQEETCRELCIYMYRVLLHARQMDAMYMPIRGGVAMAFGSHIYKFRGDIPEGEVGAEGRPKSKRSSRR